MTYFFIAFIVCTAAWTLFRYRAARRRAEYAHAAMAKSIAAAVAQK
jgi:hypothetical protein